MATYNGLIHDWKERSKGRATIFTAFTPAGIVSLETDATGDCGKLRLAPMTPYPVPPHERTRMIEDARMVGVRLTSAPKRDDKGGETWAVQIVRGKP